jgi:Transglycosylase SLT domain/LysM domain
MFISTARKGSSRPPGLQMTATPEKRYFERHIQAGVCRQGVFLLCTALLVCGSFALSGARPAARAADPGAGNACSWYRVGSGDTLSGIAAGHHSSTALLAQVNAISNINWIFVGQQLCIPYLASGDGVGGMLSGGVVRWYDYSALQWSTRPQVDALLRQAAARFGLPANLLLAIAWQESGWYQHVISHDGGIGVMQLMPYTAQALNAGTGVLRNPYALIDNIELGTTYLSWLWRDFHGSLDEVISGYNEGGWSVIHRGIFNWGYVRSVRALMRAY